mgnify:CR=1 FL=1|tara:strand:+ start:150 stop:479 length:330 start_codon:yes stop_codon:yes gene_type:complete
MEMTKIKYKNHTLIKLSGKFDTLSATKIESEFLKTLEDLSYETHIDCTELTFISSLGIRLLIIAQKKAANQDKVIGLIKINPYLKKIFDDANLSFFFKFFDSIADIDKK